MNNKAFIQGYLTKEAARYVPMSEELLDTKEALKNMHKELHLRAPIGALSGSALGYILTDPNKSQKEKFHNVVLGTGAGMALAPLLPVIKTSPMVGIPVTLAGSIGGGLLARKVYRMIAEKRGVPEEDLQRLEKDDPNILRWIRF